MKKLISICLCMMLVLIGCSGQTETETEVDDGTIVLKVYMVSPQSGGDEVYRYTDYALGEFMSLQTAYGEESYIYKQALEEYEKTQEVKLWIEYFDYTENLDAQLEEDRKNGTLPDVIVENSISSNDAYALLLSDLFLDLTPYMEQDGLYDSGNYYNAVLEAGVWQNQQRILPLSFNMNTIMSSEETLSRNHLNLETADLTDWIAQFTDCANRMQKDNRNQEALAQFVSPITFFPVNIWLSATGESFVDYEQKTVNLDRDFYKTLAQFYKEYAIQEAKGEENILNEESYMIIMET